MTVVSELRRLLAEAKAGEWCVCGRSHVYAPSSGVPEDIFAGSVAHAYHERDAALIVALRNHADALLDVVEAVDATHVTDTDHDDWYAVKGDDWDAVQAALARLDGKEAP